MSAPTNNVPPSRIDPIFPKQGAKPHHEGLEPTETGHSHSDKETQHTKYKEALSNKKKE